MDRTTSEWQPQTTIAGAGASFGDTERSIGATASYNLLLVLLIGYLVVVPHVSQAASIAISVHPETVRVVLSLLAVLVAVSVHRRLLHQIDRLVLIDRLQHAHAMRELVRRYVPDALATRLESGRDLESGPRAISVLFVDISGFTGFSENRAVGEIFSTVNRYTQTVSEIVRRHGGSVLEFSGDGMMAVFGAPNALPEKERAAVEAGSAIVEAMRSVPISVRVGIATGTDYVGDIEAADHVFWSAVGNTTNLAARLQSLTRDLHAAMVIDAPTRAASGAAAADFEPRRDVAIRGLRDKVDVYVLPISPLERPLDGLDGVPVLFRSTRSRRPAAEGREAMPS